MGVQNSSQNGWEGKLIILMLDKTKGVEGNPEALHIHSSSAAQHIIYARQIHNLRNHPCQRDMARVSLEYGRVWKTNKTSMLRRDMFHLRWKKAISALFVSIIITHHLVSRTVLYPTSVITYVMAVAAGGIEHLLCVSLLPISIFFCFRLLTFRCDTYRASTATTGNIVKMYD
jgi:hypothetical protein